MFNFFKCLVNLGALPHLTGMRYQFYLTDRVTEPPGNHPRWV